MYYCERSLKKKPEETANIVEPFTAVKQYLLEPNFNPAKVNDLNMFKADDVYQHKKTNTAI